MYILHWRCYACVRRIQKQRIKCAQPNANYIGVVTQFCAIISYTVGRTEGVHEHKTCGKFSSATTDGNIFRPDEYLTSYARLKLGMREETRVGLYVLQYNFSYTRQYQISCKSAQRLST